MNTTRRQLLLSLSLSTAIVACSDDDSSPPDDADTGIADVGADTAADATEDTAADATEDTTVDATEDTAADATEDTTADATEDTAADAEPDTGVTPGLGFEEIATDLDSPRGMACAPEGGVFVALAGRGLGADSTEGGESFPGADGRDVWFGNTGSVIHVVVDEDGTPSVTTELDGLPSVAANSPIDPTGWLDATGPNAVTVNRDGELFVAIGLGGDSCVSRVGLSDPNAAKLGTIVDGDGEIIGDFADHECANNTDGRMGPGGATPDHTSNPFRIVADHPETGQFTVVDAGANAVLTIDETGTISILEANFPDQLQTMPDLGLTDIIGVDQTEIGLPPAGIEIPSQPVPTGLAIDADGGVWVGELTGMPFIADSANVYTLGDDGPEAALSGFTTVIDLEYDGALYVLEYARTGLLGLLGFGPAPGRLSVIDETGIATQIDDGNLETPTGVVICDDWIYVSDNGVAAGVGRVLRASLTE